MLRIWTILKNDCIWFFWELQTPPLWIKGTHPFIMATSTSLANSKDVLERLLPPVDTIDEFNACFNDGNNPTHGREYVDELDVPPPPSSLDDLEYIDTLWKGRSGRRSMIHSRSGPNKRGTRSMVMRRRRITTMTRSQWQSSAISVVVWWTVMVRKKGGEK